MIVQPNPIVQPDPVVLSISMPAHAVAEPCEATAAMPLEDISGRNMPTDQSKLEILPTSSYQTSLEIATNSVDAHDEGTWILFHTLYTEEFWLTKVVRERPAISEQTVTCPGKKARLIAAVRSVLECIEEDPDREGLVNTPARCAEAILFFTSGYQLAVDDIANGALFNETHNGMVIVKDIDIHSLCEHHLVPFNGKVCVAVNSFEPQGLNL